MIIREIEIKAFGRLTNRKMSFGSGMNLIQGENETGKTTFHEFVRAMLFGLERGRGRASREDAYTRFRPWNTPGNYGGSMDVEIGGGSYRLVRDFTVSPGNLTVYDLATGAEVPDFEECILRPTGLNESSFRNACLVTQGNYPSAEELSASLGDKMIHMAAGGDRELASSQAISYLEEKKKQLGKQKLSGRMAELSEKLERAGECERELDALKKEQQEILSKLSVGSESAGMPGMGGQSGMDGRPDAGRDPVPNEEGNAGVFYFAAGMGALFLYLILGLFIPSSKDILLMGGSAFLGGVFTIVRLLPPILLFSGLIFWRHRREKNKTGALLAYRQEREELQEYRGQLSVRIETLEKQLSEVEEMEKEYRELQEECAAQQEQTEILDSAAEILRQVSGRMKETFGSGFQKELQASIQDVTQGSHEKLYLDEDFQIRLGEENQIQPLSRFSKGTVEQVYLAMSLSAGRLLFTEEMPLLLDDALVHYDDERVERALGFLTREHPGQIILASCTAREAECLENAGIPYRYLNMREELRD